MMNIFLTFLGICAIYEIIKAQYELSLYRNIIINSVKGQTKMLESFQMETLFLHSMGRMMILGFDIWEACVITAVATFVPTLWWLTLVFLSVIWFSFVGMYYNPPWRESLHKVLHVTLAFILGLIVVMSVMYGVTYL
jgi:hypothetical protein